MIRNILFDMGGIVTLQDADEARRRFRALGVDTDNQLCSHGHNGIFGALEAGEIGEDEFCSELAKMVGRQHVSHEEAEHCWLGFKKAAPLDRLHTLLELKKRYHLCMLSNTNPFVFNAHCSSGFSADGLPITHYFHSIFLSYQLKVCKPDKEFFIRAFKADKMQPDECIFIDDSLANIRTAEELGMHCIHVNTNEPWNGLLRKALI